MFLQKLDTQKICKKKVDFNGDGIIDRVEFFLGHEFKKLKEDRNGDGEFDLFIHFSKEDGEIKEVKEDNDLDGKLDIIKSYHHVKGKDQVEINFKIDDDETVSLTEVLVNTLTILNKMKFLVTVMI